MVVDGEFLKTKMKFEIQKSAKDPEGKFMASCHWLLNFTRIVTKKNKQRKTNKKSKSVEERIPKVKNFQWWANYEMASQDP